MENSADREGINLINELTQGRELARQLQIHINAPSSTHESRELLVHKILKSYEKALNLVKSNAPAGMGETQQQQTGATMAVSENRSHPSTGITFGMSESPTSLSGSPRSEDSDREYRDQDPGYASRKRKTMPRWTKHIQVSPGMGLEGPLDDGFSWRKYGQKDILGAKYPRGYYRCTYRHVQGCLATKQVQRSDEDPTILEVTYRGRHTCNQGSESNQPSVLAEKPESSSQANIHQQVSKSQQNQQEILLNFQRDLKVETKELETNSPLFPTFNFPPASDERPDSYTFCPNETHDNFSGELSRIFMPAATSRSNDFSVSPTHISGFAGIQNSYTLETEYPDLISAATSTTNSPTIGVDFPFRQMEFDPNFTFDNTGFFS
ncbi:OLC1v1027594C1 [Oldenlandia corymbosa var. corymbosa]|uniref:OLC1v1027594C1 n=1 Tax=Oldenlandia corymbosa var. corymbosa TaxID=529605 RepID=A0AAV1C9T9_OLDCO|nr:OLC1v1027594C1 [Oldenlandia corymbosa var. corymbosa]